jgi:hypothetical protein
MECSAGTGLVSSITRSSAAQTLAWLSRPRASSRESARTSSSASDGSEAAGRGELDGQRPSVERLDQRQDLALGIAGRRLDRGRPRRVQRRPLGRSQRTQLEAALGGQPQPAAAGHQEPDGARAAEPVGDRASHWLDRPFGLVEQDQLGAAGQHPL